MGNKLKSGKPDGCLAHCLEHGPNVDAQGRSKKQAAAQARLSALAFGAIDGTVSGNGGTAMCLSKQNPSVNAGSIKIFRAQFIIYDEPIKIMLPSGKRKTITEEHRKKRYTQLVRKLEREGFRVSSVLGVRDSKVVYEVEARR